jgi:hypothetical protein
MICYLNIYKNGDAEYGMKIHLCYKSRFIQVILFSMWIQVFFI